ncbi:hypothetical protein EV421DRAFT_1910262 [Armillaria borealis]|uniref:Uncharacterized protein n=1 Tax=Armillaria borealis TaxID=47425 RepID=A0AA39J2K1_9AGAR|nr:hypothetical protein EV421DRAFT_1910262 [Armillaria borealis]
MTNDDEALLGFEGRLEGATIAPITIPGSRVPCSSPNHPKFVYPPFYGSGNTNPMCTNPPDAPVVVRRHPIPTPTLSRLFSPLRLIHHHKDLTTPVFDIREYSGEVRSPPRSLHHHENGTDASPPVFPMPPTS